MEVERKQQAEKLAKAAEAKQMRDRMMQESK